MNSSDESRSRDERISDIQQEHLALAASYEENEDYENAVKEYSRCFEYGSLVGTNYHFACLCYRLEKYDLAIEHFRITLQQGPEEGVVFEVPMIKVVCQLIAAYILANRCQEAIGLLQETIETPDFYLECEDPKHYKH